MATSINLGTFYDGFSGINYTCYLIHDTPTRSGDNVTITNLKARIVSQASWGTEGRMAVSFSLPSGTSRVSNGTIAGSYSYPTDNTVTLSSSITISNLNTSFTYGISFSDTGYGTTWNSNYSKSFSGSISCPARTYSVTYNANGGSGAPAAQTKTYNVTLALSSTAPTRTGYTFLGWATSSGGSVAYGAGASYSGNADLALYAVWQAQVSTISSAGNVTLGNACNVKWTPKVSTNKYRLKFTISDFDSGYLPSSSTFVAGSSSDITYTSYTVPINGVAQKITTATTGTMTVTLYTYDSDGTLLGSDAKTFTVTVPSSCKPSVNTYTIAQTSSSTVINNWGVYVAGYSKARCQATGTAQYGATITNVTVSGDHNASGTTSLDSTSGILTAGTKTFTFTVTDSRGMTSTAVSRQATVYSYTAPAITGFTAERSASSVTTVKALGSWTYSTVASNNTVTATLKYKQSTGSTWSTASGSITSGTLKTLTEVFTDSVSYNLQLTVTDSIGNSDTRTVFLPTRFVWMHQPVGGNGVAFGKTSETGHFEVNYPIEAYGNVSTTGTYLGSGSVEYIKGTQTASTNAWTGVTKDTALYDGKMILYVLPYAGTSTGATLNLTLAGGGTTGAKSVYRYGATTAITTHYAALSRILLIYDSANNRWNSSAWYNSNLGAMSQTEATAGTATTNRGISAKVLHDTVVNLIYPVGSIYMSVNSTSPATLFGGTWVQLQNTFLLAAGSSYTAGATGGEATHTLTAQEMPIHGHNVHIFNANTTAYDAYVYDRLGTGWGKASSGGRLGSSTLAWQNASYKTAGRNWENFSPSETTAGNGDLAGATGGNGGGGAHNNMPPYLVVYMWKRTA